MKYSDVNGMKLDFSTMVEIRKGLSILDPSTMVGMTMLIGNDTPFRPDRAISTIFAFCIKVVLRAA